MNNKQIEIFLKVADERSFSKAAEKLFLTQPGVSRTIATLESELNTILFIRQYKKELLLTECGEIYYSLFSKWRDEFDATQIQCSKLNENPILNFTLGYGPHGTSHISCQKFKNTYLLVAYVQI